MKTIAEAPQPQNTFYAQPPRHWPRPPTCPPTRCLRTESSPNCVHPATAPRPRAPAQNEPNSPLRTQHSKGSLPSPRHTAPQRVTSLTRRRETNPDPTGRSLNTNAIKCNQMQHPTQNAILHPPSSMPAHHISFHPSPPSVPACLRASVPSLFHPSLPIFQEMAQYSPARTARTDRAHEQHFSGKTNHERSASHR
jgi:hypothetical protein